MARNWWEKEAQYEEMWRTGKVAKDIWKYVPKKLHDAVDETAVDSDGYWIYLADGYRAYDCGSDCRLIHAYSIEDLRKAIKTITKMVKR